MFALARLILTYSATAHPSVPHYIRDYRRLVRELIWRDGHQRAMSAAVGGDYDAIGGIEAAILTKHGLRAGHSLIDVGCGSGRLGSALSKRGGIAYHGTDVVPELLAFAKRQCPRARFTRVDKINIPAPDASVDFVTFFSVLTHLSRPESFAYLQQAKRVLKPGGKVVFSFLDMAIPSHWAIFEARANDVREKPAMCLHEFLDRATIGRFSEKLGLRLEHIEDGGDGTELGQSYAVLSKAR